MAKLQTQTDENTELLNKLTNAQVENDLWDNRLAKGLMISLAWNILLTVLVFTIWISQHRQSNQLSSQVDKNLQTQTNWVTQIEALKARLDQESTRNNTQISNLTDQVSRHLVFLRYVEDWMKTQKK
jgi:hypothetical protein